MSHSVLDSLTPREREILILIAEGKSLAEIAQHISRSLKTVESHRLSIGRKLKATNRVELAKIAIACGLITLDTLDLDPSDRNTPKAANAQSTIELQWLEQINQAVYNSPGRQYIGELCKAVTSVIGVKFCAVCVPDVKSPEVSRFTVSLAENGQLREPIWYHGPGTPAGAVASDGACVIGDNVQEAYPDDELMKSLGIQAYVGVRLANAIDGLPGVLAISHDKPVEHTESIKRVLRFFVPRTSAELVRMAQEKRLQDLNDKLQHYAVKSLENQAADGQRTYRIDLNNGMERLQLLLSTMSGSRLLRELTNALCEITGVRFAAVCVRDFSEALPSLVTLTVSESQLSGDILRYPLAGTPCKLTSEVGDFTLKSGLSERFPDDAWVVDNHLAGYVGVRLDNLAGDQLGVMWLADDQPIEHVDPLLTLLLSLAPRVAAEVEDRLVIEALHRRCESLESQVKALKK